MRGWFWQTAFTTRGGQPSVRSSTDRAEFVSLLYSRTDQGPRVRADPRQLRAAPERRGRGDGGHRRRDGEVTEPGHWGNARRAGTGGQGRPSSESTCIAFTLSSLQHLLSKKPNKHSALDGVHKRADYTRSFYKTNSFPHVSTCRRFSTGCKSVHNGLSQKRMASNRSFPGLCLGLRKSWARDFHHWACNEAPKHRCHRYPGGSTHTTETRMSKHHLQHKLLFNLLQLLRTNTRPQKIVSTSRSSWPAWGVTRLKCFKYKQKKLQS